MTRGLHGLRCSLISARLRELFRNLAGQADDHRACQSPRNMRRRRMQAPTTLASPPNCAHLHPPLRHKFGDPRNLSD